MKAQISRDSFTELKDYSAVYQQQGRMLTDADWNEMVRVLKRRMDRTVGAAIESGSPREGGILESPDQSYEDFKKKPRFRCGRVYVDGLYGEVRRVKSGTRNLTVRQFIEFQRDYPANPIQSLEANTTYTVYVDLWERLVVALEDERLTDVALHGADTCVRTQTMAQVKLAKADGFNIKNDLLPHGTAKLSVRVPAAATSGPHDCNLDSKGDTTFAKKNSLFRLEVHAVTGSRSAVQEVTLKWSTENGAEERRNGPSLEGFLTQDYVYECFSTDTERHLGEHLLEGVNGWSSLKARLYTYEDYRADLGDSESPAVKMPRIRRWDGSVTLSRNETTGQWRVADGPAAVASIEGEAPGTQDLKLALKADDRDYTVTLTLAGSGGTESFMAGDYWLVLLRDTGSGLTAEPLSQEPVGIEHHYMAIGTLQTKAANNFAYSLDKPTWRRLSFPSLTNLTLDRVLVENAAGEEVSVDDKFVDIDGDTMTGPLKFAGGGDSMVMSLSSGPVPPDTASSDRDPRIVFSPPGSGPGAAWITARSTALSLGGGPGTGAPLPSPGSSPGGPGTGAPLPSPGPGPGGPGSGTPTPTPGSASGGAGTGRPAVPLGTPSSGASGTGRPAGVPLSTGAGDAGAAPGSAVVPPGGLSGLRAVPLSTVLGGLRAVPSDAPVGSPPGGRSGTPAGSPPGGRSGTSTGTPSGGGGRGSIPPDTPSSGGGRGSIPPDTPSSGGGRGSIPLDTPSAVLSRRTTLELGAKDQGADDILLTATRHILVDAGHNVGVGTQDPRAKLDVRGPVRIDAQEPDASTPQAAELEVQASHPDTGRGFLQVPWVYTGNVQGAGGGTAGQDYARISLGSHSLDQDWDVDSWLNGHKDDDTPQIGFGFGNRLNAVLTSPGGLSIRGSLETNGAQIHGIAVVGPSSDGVTINANQRKITTSGGMCSIDFQNDNILLTPKEERISDAGPFGADRVYRTHISASQRSVIVHASNSLGSLSNSCDLIVEFEKVSINRGNLVVDGDLNVSGDFTAPSKGGCVIDYFANESGEELEIGDVVVLGNIASYYGKDGMIPIPEVDLSDKEYDSRVCGIVSSLKVDLVEGGGDDVEAPTDRASSGKKRKSSMPQKYDDLPRQEFTRIELEGLDRRKIQSGQMGKMVTLGCFAYCKVDADIKSIAIGDLLTTSKTKGHAQKVLEPSKAIGAILGKAMAPLRKGKGIIPVLVSLH